MNMTLDRRTVAEAGDLNPVDELNNELYALEETDAGARHVEGGGCMPTYGVAGPLQPEYAGKASGNMSALPSTGSSWYTDPKVLVLLAVAAVALYLVLSKDK